MASIFLSYARDDLAKGTSIAGALEAAGYEVWWDRHIGAGARFSAEIEAALEAAERVVVLWSKASVKSAWVLDEASAGRDSGRLIPVLIDKVEPPLGFRQYQAIDLSGAQSGAGAYAPLVQALGRATPSAGIGHETRARAMPWKPLLIGIAALVLIAAGWWLWAIRGGRDGQTTIAVAAATGENDGQSREFARTIAIDLSRYRAGPAGTLTIVDGNSRAARQADYRIEIGLSGSGRDRRADVSLQNPRRGRLLWSAGFERSGRALVDTRQEVTAQIGDVLRCLAELEQYGRPPSEEVESLFLNGCSIQEPSEEALSIYRRMTQLAPGFGPGWAGLAALETWSILRSSDSDRPALIAAARTHLKRAKELAPDFPDTISAEAELRTGDANRLPAALAVIERGLKRNQDSAQLHRARAEYLQDAGRMKESADEARRASELNPLSTAMRDAFISALAYYGRSAEAYAELKKAEAVWPGSSILRDLRFRLDLRFGDPREGLRLLDSDPFDQSWRKFLEARADPSPARIEAALDDYRTRFRRSPADVPSYLQALGTFGRVDEAYRAMESPAAIDGLFMGTHVLFRPYMSEIRADPRFIALSAKLGLLAFWRSSGIWPDFCADPQLPYDCRAEAAKLTPEQLRPAPALY